MLSILVLSRGVEGHVSPMLAIAAHLVRSGHRVRYLTGTGFAEVVRGSGAEFLPWPDGAELDLDTVVEDRGSARRRGMSDVAANMEWLFIAPVPGQYRAIMAALQAEHTDVVVTEGFVSGAAPLLWGDGPRPPMVACGIFPMSAPSRDTAPFGLGLPPQADAIGRLRNRMLNALVRRVVLRRPQQHLAELIRELSGGRFDGFLLDWTRRAELFAQLSVPGFEYSRSDLDTNTRFVGPALGGRARTTRLPQWWDDLSGRTVVHVSQGTFARADHEELILPTIRALADRDLLVVVTTGGGPVRGTDRLPENVRVAEFIPYDLLMPHVDVFVTNGGYGGLHYALAEGVPIVVAGDTEDKMETTRRVAWSGVGVDLRTGRPSPAAISDAVTRTLQDASFRDRARALQAEIQAAPGLDGLVEMIEAVAARGSVAAAR